MKKEKYYLSRKRRGFTLAELLIVVAIIAVLVAIAIPLFTSQLEKSREATDLANARSAYAEVMAEAVQGNYEKEITFDLKQKVYDWQTADGKVTIAGFTPADAANWIGVPGANGKCTVSYEEKTGAIFNWSGEGSSSYNFNMNENFFTALDKSKKADGLGTTGCFVFDSNTTSTTYVPAIKEQLAENSLLQKGTWAYAGAKGKQDQQYLIWTSFEMKDITKWANQTVPVIVQDRSGGYYVSESTTAVRENKDSGNYIAISAYKGSNEDVNNYAAMASGTRYSSLKDAYAAYQKALSSGKYNNLPKSEN